MEAAKLQTRLRVVLLSVPARTQAVLDFFFSSTGRSSFAPVGEDSADVAIFDFDTLESRQHWEAFHGRRGCPGIVLSTQPQNVVDAVWVQKPVTPAALLAAAAQLHQKLVVAKPVGVTAVSVQGGVAPAAPAAAPAMRVTPPAPVAVPAPQPQVSLPTAPAAAPVAAVPVPAPAPTRSPVSRTPSVSAPVPSSGFGGLLRRLFGGGKATPVAAPVAALAEDLAPTPTREPVRPAVTPTPVGRLDAAAPEATSVVTAPAPASASVTQSAVAVPAAVPVAAPAVVAMAVPAAAPVSAAPVSAPVPAAAPASPVSAPAKPEVIPVAAVGLDEKGYRRCKPEELVDEARFCGTHDDLDAAGLAEASVRYDPAQCLVGVLKDAYLVSCKWQVPAHLDSPAGRITVDGTTNLIYCEFTAEEFAAMVSKPLSKRPKTRAFSRQEFADLQGTLARRALVQRLDHVLWQTGLETAVGRLPVGLDPAAKVYLKNWPNLTRLHRTPHALRIAALWATKGASLLETAQTLKIAQRHVFAFYNAALALDLVTQDGGQVRRAQRQAKNNRGLLTRLFGWLNK